MDEDWTVEERIWTKGFETCRLPRWFSYDWIRKKQVKKDNKREIDKIVRRAEMSAGMELGSRS